MASKNITIDTMLHPSKLDDAYKPSSYEVSFLNQLLFSKHSKDRKFASMLLLHFCNNDFLVLENLEKMKSICSIKSYTGISLDFNFTLERGKQFLRRLRKDPLFMVEETKSNKFFIKFMEKKKLGTEVHVLTFTEIKYFLAKKKYRKIPDPLKCVIWFYKKPPKFKFSNLECSEAYEKLEKRRTKKKLKIGNYANSQNSKKIKNSDKISFRIRGKTSSRHNRSPQSVQSSRRGSFLSKKLRASSLFKKSNRKLKNHFSLKNKKELEKFMQTKKNDVGKGRRRGTVRNIKNVRKSLFFQTKRESKEQRGRFIALLNSEDVENQKFRNQDRSNCFGVLRKFKSRRFKVKKKKECLFFKKMKKKVLEEEY